MRFDIVTIFPEFFASIFEHGMMRRARDRGYLDIQCHDLRQYAHDRHRTVDDRPFGGGEGMVLKPEPLVEAVESLGLAQKGQRDRSRAGVILLSPQGKKYSQSTARRLSSMERAVLLCGRYEGVDERVTELVADEEISIGDYVLSGGELAAAVIVDSVMRLIPGVLGNAASSEYESFGLADRDLVDMASEGPRSTHGAGGLLDYPHYTRPAMFRGHTVPDVLSSGDHDRIRTWRRRRAIEKTWRNRPDLLAESDLSREEEEFLGELRRGAEGAKS